MFTGLIMTFKTIFILCVRILEECKKGGQIKGTVCALYIAAPVFWLAQPTLVKTNLLLWDFGNTGCLAGTASYAGF